MRAALALSTRSEVDRLLIVSDEPLLPSELRGRPANQAQARVRSDQRAARQPAHGEEVSGGGHPALRLRPGRGNKVALVACQTEGLLHEGDTILALAGRGVERSLDTLVRIRLGDEKDKPIRVDSLRPRARAQLAGGGGPRPHARSRSAPKATRATPPAPSSSSATPPR